MKKNIFYILIIIIAIGFFSPIYKLRAQNPPANPTGTCVLPDQSVNTGWTQTACTQSSGTWSGPYVLLAPLPSCKDGDPGCDCSAGSDKCVLTTFDPTGDNKIGGYLNLMIKIFIGLCAVLAVVMIVIGGIEYMTTELISSKEAGKERITHAIFGLLLALGAWTLLHQINPDILKTDLGSLQNVTVNVTFQPDNTPVFTQYNGTLPSGAQPGCPQGVARSPATGFVACDNGTLEKIDNLVEAAANAGLTISGGGYRTLDQQIALRVAKCGSANVYNASATCTVPTAVPGTSNHESGLAFDLTCGSSGTQISSASPCYTWLQANAATYGLQNLPGEPWHWSVNGH